MNILDLFSGIGGFSLGFESANFEDYDFTKLPSEQLGKSDEFFKTVAFCEIDENCKKVLRKHWSAPIFNDVKEITKESLNGVDIDIITGGFPCQDLSLAGKREGINGQRSGLFYEIIKIAGFTKPKFILFENTPELIRNKTNFKIFAQELRSIGYGFRAFLLRADAFGYLHKRQRAYIIAYPNEIGQSYNDTIFNIVSDEISRTKAKPSKTLISIHRRRFDRLKCGHENNLPDIRKDDGFSQNVERVGMLGNSVIPQIVAVFAKTIRQLND